LTPTFQEFAISQKFTSPKSEKSALLPLSLIPSRAENALKVLPLIVNLPYLSWYSRIFADPFYCHLLMMTTFSVLFSVLDSMLSYTSENLHIPTLENFETPGNFPLAPWLLSLMNIPFNSYCHHTKSAFSLKEILSLFSVYSATALSLD
jgi:hypothetical protein